MVATAVSTTRELRIMLHHGEGQPTHEWATTEARRAAIAAFEMTGSTREAVRVFDETMRAYGFVPPADDSDGGDQ